MKTNPSLTDFPANIVAACHAALDAGIFYNNQFTDFVLRQVGGYGCEATLLEIADLDAAAPNYASQQRAEHARLEAAVSAAPRGHYAIIRMSRANGGPLYTTIVSDGYGDGIATGGAYDVYDSMPSGEKILERMFAYEIYLCRKACELERTRQAGREALAKYGIRIGMTFKDIAVGGEKFSTGTVSGEKFSTGTVSEVHVESGCVTLLLTRRGSRNRWKGTRSASDIADHVKMTAKSTDPAPQDTNVLHEHTAQATFSF
jgi:hypothetical protein